MLQELGKDIATFVHRALPCDGHVARSARIRIPIGAARKRARALPNTALNAVELGEKSAGRLLRGDGDEAARLRRSARGLAPRHSKEEVYICACFFMLIVRLNFHAEIDRPRVRCS